jgi:hypothetical protein
MTRTAGTAAALAGVAAVTVAARAVTGTARGRALLRRLGMTSAGGLHAREQSADSREPESTYACHCGQRFRISGRDRHRIYWLEGAAQGDPVVSGTCPSCDRVLPAQ